MKKKEAKKLVKKIRKIHQENLEKARACECEWQQANVKQLSRAASYGKAEAVADRCFLKFMKAAQQEAYDRGALDTLEAVYGLGE